MNANFWQELRKRRAIRVVTVYAIAGWGIIQIADSTFEPLHLPGWTLTFLIVVVLLGFPITLILAWAVDPESDKTIGVDSSRIDNSYSVKNFFTSNVVISLLVVVVIGQFIYFGLLTPVASLHDPNSLPGNQSGQSIAVLPLRNMTGDETQEFFGEGMMDEILNHLAKIDGLKVTSRTSCMLYKDPVVSVKEIAATLGVKNILEGSIRMAGNQMRVTVQLINAETDQHLWSEDYDYDVQKKTIFQIQTDVSIKVASVLKFKLSPRQKEIITRPHTANLEAYKLYLRGRSFWDKRTSASYDSAEVCYKRALEIDPQYSLAFSGLADCYTFNQKGMLQTEAIPIARAYAEKALQLDSNLCEALTSIGFIQSHFEYDWEGGKKTLEKAITCNPNYPIAHIYLGNVLLFTGRPSEGLLETKKAIDLDPLSSSINMVWGRNNLFARNTDLAINQLRKTITLFPEYTPAKMALGRALLDKGNFEEAIELFSGLTNSTMTELPVEIILTYANALAGNRAEVNQKLSIPNFSSKHPFGLALIHTALGNFEEAINQLELGYEQRQIQMIHVKMDPGFDPLHNEPRFRALLKKMNLE